MLKYLQAFWQVDSKTRWFFFQVFIYTLLIILTTLYTYVRLDYVRSYDHLQEKQETNKHS